MSKYSSESLRQPGDYNPFNKSPQRCLSDLLIELLTSNIDCVPNKVLPKMMSHFSFVFFVEL